MPDLAKKALAIAREMREAERRRKGLPPTPEPQEIPLPVAAGPGAAYRQALWHLWTLPPDAPQATYDQALAEVLLQESLLPPLVAQALHREEARRFHAETGRCPFCQEPGELHLDGSGGS
ncbi:MAG: hypothetical protein HY347_04505 [candidate division NC10 bacterium]|nr:hypothetical protein [candidate division NC10 bacterium]